MWLMLMLRLRPGLNIDIVTQGVSCNGLNDGILLATPLDGTATLYL